MLKLTTVFWGSWRICWGSAGDRGGSWRIGKLSSRLYYSHCKKLSPLRPVIEPIWKKVENNCWLGSYFFGWCRSSVFISPFRLTTNESSPRFIPARRQVLVNLYRICTRVMQYPNKSLLPRRWSSSSWDRRARKFSQNVTDLNRLSWLGSRKDRNKISR